MNFFGHKRGNAGGGSYPHHASNDEGDPPSVFGLCSVAERDGLFANIAAAMSGIPAPVSERQACRADGFEREHEQVRKALGQ